METAFGIISGIALIVSGFALNRLRPPDWGSFDTPTDSNQLAISRWARLQRVVRRTNNGFIVLSGLLIMVTSFVPHGKAWMILWAGILLLLMICILLAMLDALSSMAGYRRAIPEAARRTLSGENQQPSS